MDIFEQLLDDLSHVMNITLKPDANQSCLIRLKDKINIQLELDKAQENLTFGVMLGELQVGKYRENVLKEALKANYDKSPFMGVLAFSDKKNALVLFQITSIQNLTGEQIYSTMLELFDKALPWQDALSRGEVPYISTGSSKIAQESNIFNLKL